MGKIDKVLQVLNLANIFEEIFGEVERTKGNQVDEA